MNQSLSGVETKAVPVVPRLDRVLTLWDLILYGIVSATPRTPVTVFGLASKMCRGHRTVTEIFQSDLHIA